MMRINKIFLPLAVVVVTWLASCSGASVPKPYGYVRITLPDTAYTHFVSDRLPYAFDLSNNARVDYRPDDAEWMDVVYPTLNARIYCSYQPVHGNLAQLSDDANSFVYKHAVMADAIPEKAYENPEKHVYGVLYELYGNTASPLQVVLTDSTRHFFRAALYFNCTPNQDSLAPVINYMHADFLRLVESFEWQP